jgi:SAM-dependent methyltransferase
VVSISIEPGSFRDKANRVFYRDGRVLRALSQTALENWSLVSSKQFFRDLMEQGKAIQTREADRALLPGGVQSAWAGVLEHDRIPFVSYPYEWSFSMLREAALLQLELLEQALREGMTLKDASVYNMQFKGAQPVFIDIPSFIPWKPGEPWAGYRQFCELFLNPLLLQAYRNIPFQPWMRGSVDGISSEICSRLLSRDFHKRGVLKDVLIHAYMQRRYANSSRAVRSDLQEAGFQKEMILANVRRLTKIVSGLQWKDRASHWSTYVQDNSYNDEDSRAKLNFVSSVLEGNKYELIWDLGCNTGEFSKLSARHAEYVVAVDSDPQVVDALFHSLQKTGPKNILPLTAQLSDLSPGLGWLGKERKAFVDRGHPDLMLCLALVHHMCISANIPLNEWIQWLATGHADLIIEFVRPEDPMVQQLLRNKEGNHDDYDQDVFENMLSEAFRLEKKEVLSSGTRILYSCKTRAKRN